MQTKEFTKLEEAIGCHDPKDNDRVTKMTDGIADVIFAHSTGDEDPADDALEILNARSDVLLLVPSLDNLQCDRDFGCVHQQWEVRMKKFLIAATVTAALTGSAFAGSCPTLMKKVDDALSTTTISADDKSTVMELRQKGEQQHASGMHKESIATLNEALKHLGM